MYHIILACTFIERFFMSPISNETILSLYLPIHNPLRYISQNMFLHLPAPRLRHLIKTDLLVAKPKNVSWGLMPSQNFSDPRSELFVCRSVYTAGSC